MEGRTEQREPVDPAFGAWLSRVIAQRGIGVKVLATRARIGQPTVSMLKNAQRKPSRETVVAIVGALLPPDADDRVRASLLRDALYAAGYAAPGDVPDLTSEKVREIAAKASLLPEAQQEAILRLVDSMAPDAGREGEESEPPPPGTREG